ncbi:MAG: phosphatidylglycerophosphatase A [Pseudomonadota bacterium]
MRFFVKTLSSVLGLGYVPFAPGTWGTLGGAIFWYFVMRELPLYIYVAWTVVICVLSCYIAGLAEKAYGKEDDQRIVIDEFCGFLVTMIGINGGFYWGFAGFVLFRLFDISKPYPIRRFESLPHGIGVVADDVMAGVYGCVILNLARYFLVR